MTRSAREDELIDSHQVVLILRLTLDRDEHLRHGELLDSGAIGQGRFKSLTDLGETVQQWLERQRADRSQDVKTES